MSEVKKLAIVIWSEKKDEVKLSIEVFNDEVLRKKRYLELKEDPKVVQLQKLTLHPDYRKK